MVSLGSRFQGSGRFADPNTRARPARSPIRATLAPALAAGDLVLGGTVRDMVGFAGFAAASNYASTAGSIVSVVATEILDGLASAEGTTGTALSHPGTVAVRFTVTDSAANTRVFLTETRAVALAPAPATAGAALALDAALAGLAVGTETVIDLRGLFVSAYALGFEASIGAIDGDGFTWRWTPSYGEYALFGAGNADLTVTATDAHGQQGMAAWEGGSIALTNEAPQYSSRTLTFAVPVGTAPVLAGGSPADGATGVAADAAPFAQWDQPVRAGSGAVALHSITDGADVEVLTLPGAPGAGPGSIWIAGDRVHFTPTAAFAGGRTIGWTFAAGALTNLGGIGIAAVTDPSVLDFTTAAPAAAAPGAMAAGTHFAVADAATGGDAVLSLLAAPADGGAAIAGYEYRVGPAGAWTAAGMLAAPVTLADLFADGVATDVGCRAVNAAGAGPDGTPASVTTTAPAASLTLTPLAAYNATNPGSATQESAAFDTTAGRPLFLFVHLYSNATAADALISCTVGAAGRGSGGTALSLVGSRNSSRVNVLVFRLDAPATASGQTVRFTVANGTPRALTYRVFEVPGADTAGAAANVATPGPTSSTGESYALSGGAAGDLAVWAITTGWAAGSYGTSGATEAYNLGSGGSSATSDHRAMLLWREKTGSSDETAGTTLPAALAAVVCKFTIPRA